MSTNGHQDAAASPCSANTSAHHLKARVREVNGNAALPHFTVNGQVNGHSNGYSNCMKQAPQDGEEGGAGWLLRRVLDLVLKTKLVTGLDVSEKVVHFKHPHELQVSVISPQQLRVQVVITFSFRPSVR